MGPRYLTGVLLIGLFIAAAGLVIWLTQHARAKRSLLDPKAVCVLAVLSFVFVGFGMLASTLPSSGKLTLANGKEVPSNLFATIPPAIFHMVALLTTIGLVLAAAFRLVSGLYSPLRAERWRDAARLAAYGIGALMVAVGHFILMKLGSGLLK
jgi:hypothetical protein